MGLGLNKQGNQRSVLGGNQSNEVNIVTGGYHQPSSAYFVDDSTRLNQERIKQQEV